MLRSACRDVKVLFWLPSMAFIFRFAWANAFLSVPLFRMRALTQPDQRPRWCACKILFRFTLVGT